MENVLNDFITAVIEQENLNISLEDARKIVTQEAKKQAVGNCACLTEDEVYDIVLNSPNLLAEEKKKGKKASDVSTDEIINAAKKKVASKSKAKDLLAKAEMIEEMPLFTDEDEEDCSDFEYEG